MKVGIEYTKVVTEQVEMPDELYAPLKLCQDRFGFDPKNEAQSTAVDKFYELMRKHVEHNTHPNVDSDLQVLIGFTFDGENFDA